MTSYYSNILRDVEEDRISQLKTDRWIFAFLLMAVGVVPLLIGGYAKVIISPHITNIEMLTSGTKGDMFTHYKAIALLIITVASVGLLLSKVFFMNGKIRRTKLNIFLGFFVVAIVLSTIFSPSISIALWGQYNRSDGAISYICYIALFFVAMNINYPKKALQYVMYSMYPFVFINFILITMNFYGNDLMDYSSMQKLMSLFLPQGASLGDNSTIIGTLNQWNFMSGMFAIMTLMYLGLAIVDSSIVKSLVNTTVAVVSFAIMLMSISTSGFVTFAALIPLLVVLIVKSGNHKKSTIVLLIFFIISAPSFHILAEKNPLVWNESIGFIIKKNPYLKEQTSEMKSLNFNFTLEKRVLAAENQFELPELPESGVSAGSGRTYIWQKTFDITMDRPLFGYGLDTLMYHFPHYNIDARSGMRNEDIVVDKPHSMYVGIFYGTGLIGIIGFAGIAILTFLVALKIVFCKKQSIVSVLAIGWIAFLIQALFNDSLPGTAGPMWVIAGIMMGMILIKNEVEGKIDGRND